MHAKNRENGETDQVTNDPLAEPSKSVPTRIHGN